MIEFAGFMDNTAMYYWSNDMYH